MGLELTATDISWLAATFLCVVVGVATRRESRMLMAALVVAVGSDSPSAVAAVAVLGVVAKGLEVIRLW